MNNIRNYLNEKEFITRTELCTKTGLSDRKIRDKISKLKKEETIISNSHNKGYRLAKDIQKIQDISEAKKELSNINDCINEVNARIDDLAETQKQYLIYKMQLLNKIKDIEYFTSN